jgi:hypothetical protein
MAGDRPRRDTVGMTPDSQAFTQRQAIAGLVEQGVLNDEQAAAVLAAIAPASAAPPGKASWVPELAAYLGGGLMLGGLVWVLAQSWDRLSRGGQVGVLALISAALAVAGLVAAGGIVALRDAEQSPRTRVVTVLLVLAVIPVMPAVVIALDNVDHRVVYGALAAMAAAVVAYLLMPNALSVVSMGGWSIAVASSLTELLGESSAISRPAVTFVAVGSAWAIVSAYGLIKPRALGFGIGSGFALLGAQLQLSAAENDWLAYLATTLVAVGCLLAYLVVRHAVLIIAAVVGLTLAVPEAAYDWSDGRLQVAYIVLIGGAVMVAGSVAALRWRGLGVHSAHT